MTDLIDSLRDRYIRAVAERLAREAARVIGAEIARAFTADEAIRPVIFFCPHGPRRFKVEPGEQQRIYL